MTDNPKDLIGSKKAPLSLVPPALLIAASEALGDGAAKYGPFNYRSAGVRASIYYEALLRHVSAWWDGEEVAADSGVHHLAHAVGCLAILLDTKSIDMLIDDRPPAGAAAALLAQLDKSKAVEPWSQVDLTPVIAKHRADIARFVASTTEVVDTAQATDARYAKPGDHIRVTANTSGHYFDINEVVVVEEISEPDADPEFRCSHLDGRDYWWVRGSEAVPVGAAAD